MNEVAPCSSGGKSLSRSASCQDQAELSSRRRMERSKPTSHSPLPKVATLGPCASHTHTAEGDPSLAVVKMTNKTSLSCPEPLGAFGSNIRRCVVRLEALDSKYLRLSPLKATKDTEENGTIHQHSTLSLRGTSQHTRLKRPCTVCCAVKRTFSANFKRATDVPQKQKRIQAKEVKSKQASRKLVEGLKIYPVVSLCNIANIFKIPADSLNVRCILSKELQRKSIRCFKRDHSDRPYVEFLSAPCMNVEISNYLHVHPDSRASSVGQRPQDTPDVTSCPSGVNLVGNCDIHIKRNKTCINDYDNCLKKRMSLTNGKNTFFPQDSRLNESDITMHISASTPVPSSCELEPFSGSCVPSFPTMVKMDLSAMPPSNPSTCDKKNRVEKNTRTGAGSVLTMEADENKLFVGQGRGTGPDRDRETDREIAESSSCQRTTPYSARVFCSRTCIVWPFSKLGSFQKNFIKWNDRKPVSGPSMYTKCDGDTANDFAANFNRSDCRKKTNSTTAQDTGGEIKVGNQHPTFPEQEVSVQAKNTESFTLQEESAAVASSDFLRHLKQKTSDDPKVCSTSPTISAKVNQERNACVVKENSQLGVTKSRQKQRPSLNVLKSFEKKHSGPTATGVSELRKLQVASENGLASSFPSGRSTDVKPKWESREFSFPQVSMVCANLSSDDDHDNSNLSSEEGLVDDIYPLCGVIMCDIRDTPTGSPKEPSYSRKEGASGGKMDLITAYEEDALVLDVIQDDPELFGNISEETTEKDNKKSQPPSVVKTEGPKDSPVTRTNHRILWDGKESDPRESKVNSECLGYPDISTEWCINNDFKCNVQEDSRAQQHATAPGSSDGRVDRTFYCKYYFGIHHNCFRKPCMYLHVPTDRDEKFCMEVVQNFSRCMNPSHLQRAVAVFVSYYQKCSPGIHFRLEELKFLLKALFSRGFVKDLLDVLRVSTFRKILLPPEFILSLFEYVRLYGFHVLTVDLINVTSLCVDAGLAFTVQHFVHMQYCLESLKTPSQQINLFQAIKHRALNSSVCNMKTDLPHIFTEVERCKEQEDWASLGHMFRDLCLCNCSLPELQHFSSIISRALLRDQTAAPLPFIPFVRAVCQGSTTNEVIKNLLGHIGVSLMFEYCKSQHWKKGRMLLDVLNEQKVSYVKLKTLFGNEEALSLRWTVSIAAEVFLNTGSLEGAFDLLKALCQAILCLLADGAVLRGIHGEVLEALTNLPGLQHCADTLDVSQYSKIFNQHLKSCIEKQSLTMAFNTVDFMIMKDILVNQSLLRSLIHKLGRQNIWRKARLLYKHAMSMGYYPVAQVNENCKVLPIPHTLTEIEMTIAIEMFMATNASDIWGQTQPSQLQIVLKRKADMELISEDGYSAAGNCLLSTAQIANPKLVIKYTTVNLSQDQVFTLEPRSVSKWLNQNIKWTTEIWQQPSQNPGTSDCPSS